MLAINLALIDLKSCSDPVKVTSLFLQDLLVTFKARFIFPERDYLFKGKGRIEM